MCKDCGCTIAGMEHNHSHNHDHGHGHSHHHHDHENRAIFKPINDNLKTSNLFIKKSKKSSKTIVVYSKETYNDLSRMKFFTHRHAQINDENEHEKVFERWLLRLLYKI